VIKVGSAESDN